MRRHAFELSLALAACTALPCDARAQSDATSPIRKRTAYEDLQLFGQVLNQIRVNHPDSIEAHDLFVAAVEGMVQAADPHSYVIPAVRLEEGKQEAYDDGRLHPVPISFAYVGGAPVVVSVAAGTAARQLDILPGDELVAIQGANVTAHSAEELDIVLSGAKKSTVRLTFERRRDDGSIVRLERAVKREKGDDESAVPTAFLLEPITGYVRVTTFVGERVADDLHAALDRLEKAGMQRLILDLRDNGGGSVAEAAHVAGEFLPRGTIVYTTDGRKPEITDTGRVKRSFWKDQRRYPMVVMVNGGTASASELVAGALQDHDRAIIFGRPTYGKSLLMRGFPMSDGSLLMLVVGHVRTPCGRVVQRQYRSISRREYYRLARADRDTAGRPTCRTDAGRIAYGGGGIFPDVALSAAVPAPSWVGRIEELQLPLSWSGGYVEAHASTLGSPDTFASHDLPAAALADFRAFAGRQGLTIPADGDPMIQEILLRSVAYAKWGSAGVYRVIALRDAAIRQATTAFEQASALNGPSH